jgi:hypothetical protein
MLGCLRSSSGVSIYTFVPVKQVIWAPSTRPRVGTLMRCFQHFHSMRCFSNNIQMRGNDIDKMLFPCNHIYSSSIAIRYTNAWMPSQLLRCQYLCLCTSKASNLSTAAHAPHSFRNGPPFSAANAFRSLHTYPRAFHLRPGNLREWRRQSWRSRTR